nr:helix-turn-helix domain-containing protein [Caulobacter segnis]
MGNVERLHLDDVEAETAPFAVAEAVVSEPMQHEPADIGAALKAAREARGLSLQQVAEATRIRQGYVEALEEMRLEALPSRPFTIGYVRAYAALLGMDGDTAVARFKTDAPDEGAELREPVGVRRERDPRLALILAGGVLVVGAILLWNVAQRAIAKDQPPQQIAPAAASTQVQAHANNSSVALGAPLPAPVESTTPEPYKTPGLDDAAANGGSVDAAKAAAKARAEADARAGIVDPAHQVQVGAPFKPRGVMLGAAQGEGSGVVLQARKPATLVVRGVDGQVYFARALTAGDAYRAPRTPGLIADVSDPMVFEVYYGGALVSHLPSNSTALSKLVPAPKVAPAAPAVAQTAPAATPPQ